MKAMIFAAGLGTRFKPWTDNNPKALAIVNGKSLLQRNIEYLQVFGIKDVIVNIHHFPGHIISAIKENNGWGSNVTISDESEEVLETGGGLMNAKELLGKETFITINVDILTDLNINHFIDHHRASEALISLAIAERQTTRYLLFDKDQYLCGWRNIKEGHIIEKISAPAAEYLQRAYSGIAVFEPSVFDQVEYTGKFSLIDIFLLLAQNREVRGYDHTGDKWIDVGRPESVAASELLFP
jgi:NDP-sugar pyrophosphorylase family protein